ncbi:cytochrome b [Reinekea marinisedimentorum]|uniref:Cytochrome b561 n=1 Tax=Reinekea marinisedimentorum TaxID=230495 RepID=A0A4R3IBB1_9GAMM|nr:cytochrome b [Reinekea marinisedimentorum]TCS43274.1 cytochrome b561 [Reinekea marinisedimentorum]
MASYKRHSIPTIILHWLVALGMIGTATLGILVTSMERGPDQHTLMNIHKALGVLTLAFAVVRVIWRTREGKLESLGNMPRWQQIAAASTHGLLLFATLLIPISGLMISIGLGYSVTVFGLPFIPQTDLQIEWLSDLGYTLHGAAKYVLIAVVVAHAMAAIKHEVVNKDGTTLRMLGFGNKY